MRLMRSACIALSMYTRLPVPQFSWEEEDMQYAICFFPTRMVLWIPATRCSPGAEESGVLRS